MCSSAGLIAEKRLEEREAHLDRIEDSMLRIENSIAAVASRDTLQNWGLAIIAALLVAGFGVGEVMLQTSGNQLIAFRAGPSTIQAAVAASPTLLNPEPASLHERPSRSDYRVGG
jgi:hypothetical protein